MSSRSIAVLALAVASCARPAATPRSTPPPAVRPPEPIAVDPFVNRLARILCFDEIACDAACDRGHDATACATLQAVRSRRGDGIGAVRAAERACLIGNEPMCRAAVEPLVSEGPLGDEERAVPLLEKGCELGNVEHCLLGDTLGSERSVALLVRACDLGSSQACNRAAFRYAAGKEIDRDDVRARALFAKACDAGHASACTTYGLWLRQGRGGERDGAGAIEHYRKACELGHDWGCSNLGQNYQIGRFVARDPRVAMEMFVKACHLGLRFACLKQARMLESGDGVAKDKKRAEKMFAELCTEGLLDACPADGGRPRVSCAQTIDRLIELGAGDPPQPDEIVRGDLIDECEATSWSAGIRQCAIDSRTAEEARRCVAK